MRRLMLLLILSAASCGLLLATEDADTQLEKANNVVNEIMRTPDKTVPHDLLDKALCVGIVPSELRFALGIGGTYGRGVLVCRKGGNGAWGAPFMFDLGGANFGFQIGGKATDVVFIVMNRSGMRKLVEDKIKLGADASVTAGPVGRTAEGATDAQLHAEILSYSRTRGLFAGVSLEGAVFRADKAGNERLYDRNVTAKEVLLRGEVSAPSAARPLLSSLRKYSPHGGQPLGTSASAR